MAVRMAAFLLIVLLGVALPGCTITAIEPASGDSPATANQKPAQAANLRGQMLPQGSAVYLRDNVLLISVYVTDGKAIWSEEDIAQTKKSMEVATDWIESQAAQYDVPLHLFWEEEDLNYEWNKRGLLEESYSDIPYTYCNTVGEYLSTMPSKALRKKYKAGSIGYIFFYPASYSAYAYPYEAVGVDSIDRFAYNEFCTLYLYDGDEDDALYETPATYAHEILHLFGACDLYEENKTDHISTDLVDHIERDYPHEIMYYTYEDDNSSNYEEITKMLSPYTLYFLDWDDGAKAIERFPEIEREAPAAFE